MKEKIKYQNKLFWVWIAIIFVVLFAIVPIIVRDYQYNKCVRINKEEFKKCENREFGNYDCSIFENAEELCNMAIFRK